MMISDFKYNHTAVLNNIKEAMSESNMTVTHLAERVGMTQAGLSNFLNGRSASIKVSTLHQFSKALDIEISELIGDLPRRSIDSDIRTLRRIVRTRGIARCLMEIAELAQKREAK